FQPVEGNGSQQRQQQPGGQEARQPCPAETGAVAVGEGVAAVPPETQQHRAEAAERIGPGGVGAQAGQQYVQGPGQQQLRQADQHEALTLAVQGRGKGGRQGENVASAAAVAGRVGLPSAATIQETPSWQNIPCTWSSSPP